VIICHKDRRNGVFHTRPGHLFERNRTYRLAYHPLTLIHERFSVR
jgi:hypothetical protein